MRVLADTAGFNFAFAGVALSADTGASYHLPRLVGQAKALELLYFPSTDLGRRVEALGLANQVVPGRRARGDRERPRHPPRRRPHGGFAAIRQSVAFSVAELVRRLARQRGRRR